MSLETKIIHAYNLNENTGTFTEDGAGDKDGTLSRSDLWSSDSDGVGITNNGSDGDVSLGSVVLPAGKGSASVTFKTTSQNRQGFIATTGDLQNFRIIVINYQPGIGGSSPGKVAIRLQNGASDYSYYFDAGAALYNGQKHTITVSWESNTTSVFYFDGVAQTVTQVATSAIASITQNLNIGSEYVGGTGAVRGNFFNGTIYRAYVFDDTLTTGEFTELYNSGDDLEFPFASGPTTPTVTTQAATSVTHNSATLNGNVTNLAEEATVARTFDYRVVGAGSWTRTTPETGIDATGAYTAAISSLNAEKDYEYRAVVIYDTDQEVYGTTESFTTLAAPASAPPVVTTQAATDVAKNTVTLNGNLTDLGDETNVDVAFEYRIKNTETPNTWTATADQARTTTGAYTEAVTGLTAETLYEARAIVKWDGTEESEGDIVEFTTLALDPPTVTTQAATDVADDSVQLNGNLTSLGDHTPVDVYFEYRIKNTETPNAWTATADQERTATGTFNVIPTGLTAETVYEFRAMVTYDTDQTVTGSTLEFTTLAEPTVGDPTVTTQAATEVGETTANVNGNLTSLGDEAAVDVLFQYRISGSPTWLETTAVERTETGTFNAALSSLLDGATYQFRAIVRWTDGTEQQVNGSTLTFNTIAIPLPQAVITINDPKLGQNFLAYTVEFDFDVDTDGQIGDVYLFVDKPADSPVEDADFTWNITTPGTYNYTQTVENVGANPSALNDVTAYVRFVPSTP